MPHDRAQLALDLSAPERQKTPVPSWPGEGPLRLRRPGGRTSRSAGAAVPGACSRLLATSVLLLGLCGGSASAAVVTFNKNFEVGVDYADLMVDGTFNLPKQGLQLASLQRFDAALGTLTGVAFGFFSTVDLEILGRAIDTNPERYLINGPSPLPPNETSFDAQLDVDLALNLFEPAGSDGYTRSAQISDTCFVRGEIDPVRCELERRQSLGLSATLGLSGVALSDFIGTDDINFFASMTSRLIGSCQDDIGDDCKFSQAGTGASWKGVATVVYTYDAVNAGGGGTGGGGTGGGVGGAGHSVPEPASAWLAALALVGLALQKSPWRSLQTIRGV